MAPKSKMIPKVIHYFWFSDEEMPPKLQMCLESWREIMPDFQIKKWDLNNTKINTPFAKQALEDKKWAFLTDYCRMRVLFEEGGIYMDTDVLVVKSFDDLLNNDSFWGTADNGMIEPVVVGAVKENKIIKQCVEYYESDKAIEQAYLEIPKVILPIFEKKGFDINDLNIQEIEGAKIFPFRYFCPLPFEKADTKNYRSFADKDSYAIHLWNANWFDPFRFFWNGRYSSGWRAVWKTFKENPFREVGFYRSVFFHLRSQIFGYPSKQKSE